MHSHRILIVDDEPLMGRLMERILRRKVPTVLECNMAHNGREALEVLEAADFQHSLILTDIMMPVMDGISMIREIRRRCPSAAPPIITITAYSDAARWQTCQDLGVADYFVKPFCNQALVDRVSEILGVTPEPVLSGAELGGGTIC